MEIHASSRTTQQYLSGVHQGTMSTGQIDSLPERCQGLNQNCLPPPIASTWVSGQRDNRETMFKRIWSLVLTDFIHYAQGSPDFICTSDRVGGLSLLLRGVGPDLLSNKLANLILGDKIARLGHADEFHGLCHRCSIYLE